MADKNISVSDFLTDAELLLAFAIWQDSKTAFVDRVCKEIIEPNIERINKALGQENDPRYLAYMVEYCLIKSQERG